HVGCEQKRRYCTRWVGSSRRLGSVDRTTGPACITAAWTNPGGLFILAPLIYFPYAGFHELLADQIRTLRIQLATAERRQENRLDRGAQLCGAQQPAGDEERRSGVFLPQQRGTGDRRHRQGVARALSRSHRRTR